MTKFTILIAVYNAEAYLEETLDSLCRQTEGNFQAICIDDCSTDDSWEILHRRAAGDSRFELLRTAENSGQAVARNLGLEQARGELTLFLDADDTLADDALELIWQDYKRASDIDAIVMTLVLTDEGGNVIKDWAFPTKKRILTGNEACLLSIDWELHGVYAVRTEIHKAWPYSTTLRQYSDDNTTRLHYKYSRCVALSSATYYYRQHGASCTHVLDVRRTDFLRANMELRELLEVHGGERKQLCRCEHFCWYNLVAMYREMLVHRADFSDTEWHIVQQRFRTSFYAIRPWRLSLRILRHPSTVYVWPFSLFRAWAWFTWKLKGGKAWRV